MVTGSSVLRWLLQAHGVNVPTKPVVFSPDTTAYVGNAQSHQYLSSPALAPKGSECELYTKHAFPTSYMSSITLFCRFVCMHVHLFHCMYYDSCTCLSTLVQSMYVLWKNGGRYLKVILTDNAMASHSVFHISVQMGIEGKQSVSQKIRL